jgi:YHS domain-containing protein
MNLPGNVIKVEGKTKHFACPVCHGEGVVSKDDQFVVHQGKMHYYFCSENCKVEFEKDPQKYIKEMGTH